MFILQKEDRENTYNRVFYEIKEDLFHTEKRFFPCGTFSRNIEIVYCMHHRKDGAFLMYKIIMILYAHKKSESHMIQYNDTFRR